MKKLLTAFREIPQIVLLIKRSNYSVAQKFQIFFFLLSNIFNDLFGNKKKEISQEIFGFKISAFDYHTLKYLFKEIFLSEEYVFEASTNAPRIIDCGANIGMSILLFKYLYPNSVIVAFEPNPYAFSLLQKNVKQNQLMGVQLYNIGLSNNNGEFDFFISENKGSLQGSILKARGGDNKVRVELQKLSTYMALHILI